MEPGDTHTGKGVIERLGQATSPRPGKEFRMDQKRIRKEGREGGEGENRVLIST